MVGEHSEGAHHEPAVQRPDGQRHVQSGPAILVQQLLEPLQLSFVVAENERGEIAGEQAPQPLEVAIHSLRRQEPGLQVCRLVPQREPGELMQPTLPAFGGLENFLSGRHFLPQAPSHH